MIKKILIANRGEIAIRVMRACHEMGIASVAVYSEADKDALFAKYADEAYLIGPAPASQSYLNIQKVIDTAKQSGADAIHPGYGFLAENPKFAAAYNNRGFVYWKLGNYKQAIEDCNKAIELNPKYAQAYKNRGSAYGNLGDFRQAIEDIKTAGRLGDESARKFLKSHAIGW